MHDVEWRAHLVDGRVRRVQAGEHLCGDRYRDADRNLLIRLVHVAQQHVQRNAVHVLLHEHDFVGRGDEIEHRHDVGMVDLRRDARLFEKHRDEVTVLGELGEQALGRDQAAEPLVTHQACDVDRRHTAARDLPVKQIAADRHGLSFLGIVGHGRAQCDLTPSTYSKN